PACEPVVQAAVGDDGEEDATRASTGSIRADRERAFEVSESRRGVDESMGIELEGPRHARIAAHDVARELAADLQVGAVLADARPPLGIDGLRRERSVDGLRARAVTREREVPRRDRAGYQR